MGTADDRERPNPENEADSPPERVKSPFTGFMLGLAAGALSGVFGIGGSFALSGGLTVLLRIRSRRANGTAVTLMLVGAVVALLRYHQEAAARELPGIQITPVFILAAGCVLGALIGTVLGAIGPLQRQRHWFGLAVVPLAATLFWAPHNGLLGGLTSPDAPLGPVGWVLLFGIGLMVNILAGYLRLGGGLLLIPALALLSGYPQPLAQATSLAVIVAASAAGAVIHIVRGNVVRELAFPIAIGAATGAWFLGWAPLTVPEPYLRGAFGVLLGVVGCRLLLSGLRRPNDGPAEPTNTEG